MDLPTDLRLLLGDKINDWDVFMVGDGSGSIQGRPGGWAVITYVRNPSRTKLFYGSVSDTTINIAELMPYIHSFHWYANNLGKRALKNSSDGLIKVYVITDCDIIAKQGNKEVGREQNSPLWSFFDQYECRGYVFKWFYLARDTSEVNRECDALSKQMRLLVQTIDDRLTNIQL